MELKVKNDVFYALEAGKEKRLYDTERDAIESLKTFISGNKELNPENVSIMEVNIKGEKWEMKQIPWSKIAIELIRGGK
jgi:hypothetical protein